jgi:Fe-S cluster assembly iron-binding protein IscA
MVLDEPRKYDEIIHYNGIEIVYPTQEKDLFDHTFIDFKDSWYGEGFVICSPSSEPC